MRCGASRASFMAGRCTPLPKVMPPWQMRRCRPPAGSWAFRPPLATRDPTGNPRDEARILANVPTPESWSLHPQLARDTVAIGDLALSRVLVVNDANWPWLLLVPRREGASEIIDLDEVERAQLMTEIARAGH